MATLTDLKNWLGDHITGPLVSNPLINPAGVALEKVGNVQAGVTNEVNSLTGNYTPSQLAAQQAQAAKNQPPGYPLPSTPGFANWAVGFGALVVVLLLLSEGKHTSEFGAALGVVIAGTVVLKDGDKVVAEINNLFGTTIAVPSS